MATAAPSTPKPPETIDQVIAALEEIIEWARNTESRIGYFAALYRRVTQAVKDGISQGKFQNGPRMEKLDVIFATRYLQALQQFQSGQPATQSWQLAFNTASDSKPLIVQQLLISMNAHINVDLPVATATVAPGDQLPGLKPDFDQINAVLAGEVGAVEQEIAEVSPWIALLEKFGLKTETAVINFSIDKARDVAWSEASKLAVTPSDQLQAVIHDLDVRTELFGHVVLVRTFGTRIIRWRESNDVRHVIDVLASQPAARAASN